MLESADPALPAVLNSVAQALLGLLVLTRITPALPLGYGRSELCSKGLSEDAAVCDGEVHSAVLCSALRPAWIWCFVENL